MQPYELAGTPRPFQLTPEKLRSAPQVPGVASTVAFFDIPLNEMLVPRGGGQLRFFVKAAQLFGAVAAGPATVRVTDCRMIRSPRSAPAFPSSQHPDVLAWAVVGGVYVLIPVTAVNFATGDVTVTAPAVNTAIRVAYLPGEGEFEFRAERPNGSDTVNTKLYGNSFRAMHETNQDNLRSAPRFGSQNGTPQALAPQFRLSLTCRTPAKIFWDRDAQNELSILSDILPIKVLNGPQLAAMAELQNRGGYV